ncbi:hypothetical protein [Methanocella arvoryzae]|uniref:Uncharacterized protein n=1 Tax=Methanocella arvoryzae (strain DSM 22066 / NBRC 105507 / MRE50) TaxID=351160 RepID=Q0W4E8_METAR|nr:hypothetical protein [Methanocella arvoryzae]CAJ36745.1 hypothetical protein RCIX1479 [Methanocella arvoryzae MRE50]
MTAGYEFSTNRTFFEDGCSSQSVPSPAVTGFGQYGVSGSLCINGRYAISEPGVVAALLNLGHTTSYPALGKLFSRSVVTDSSTIRKVEVKSRQMLRVRKLIDEQLARESDVPFDTDALIESIMGMMEKIGYEKIQCTPDRELAARVKKIILMEKLSMTIDTSNETEVREFDEAVKRRSFFK